MKYIGYNFLVNPTLTIGIPVYNENAHIRKTIGNLAKIINQVDHKIELIIVDNCSTDGTWNYLKTLETSPPNINLRIVHNIKNEGFNFSVDLIMKQARNDYLWIIGGHDQIHLEGLKIVLEAIKNNPTYLIGNATIRDESSNTIINKSLWGNIKSRDFINLEQFFITLGGPCQAMSCNIFNTKEVQQFNNDKHLTKHWIFIERAIDILLANESKLLIKFIDKPIVEMLIETDGWQITGDLGSMKEYGSFFTSLELIELVNQKFTNRPRIIYTYPIWRDIFAIPRTFIIAKSKGLPINLKLVMRVIKVYKRSKLFWVAGVPILLCPKFVAKNLLRLKFLVHISRRVFGIKTF
jgi:glycosyltransferase involved in cell wall biosynthesis